MYDLAPIGYLSGAGLKVTGSSWGGGRGASPGDFNGIGHSRGQARSPSPVESEGWIFRVLKLAFLLMQLKSGAEGWGRGGGSPTAWWDCWGQGANIRAPTHPVYSSRNEQAWQTPSQPLRKGLFSKLKTSHIPHHHQPPWSSSRPGA